MLDAQISGKFDDVSFENMTVVGQLKAIESVIDEQIRPTLMMDGGNMEILPWRVVPEQT